MSVGPSGQEPAPPVEALAVALACADLAHIIDLVAYPVPGDPPAVVVRNADGAVRLWLTESGEERHELLTGRDPVGNTDPLAFLPYRLECADPGPDNSRNSYPEPARRLLAFFADPDRSPDLVVVHSPRHYFPEHGGHRGEHGSLDVIQSRAPFLISGAGVRALGLVADHARTVDVAPTLLHLAGVPAEQHRDADGASLDGAARTDLAEAGAGRFVIGLLWDGAHCSDLLSMAAAGELPAVARLLAAGSALTGGAVAEFPSVTLCNHTSALTGVSPGRHGVLGNIFYDRARGERILANDETTWHRSADWLRPGVLTVFEMLTRAQPSAHSACLNEPIDRGATTSTMQVIRAAGDERGAGGLDDLLPAAEDSPYLGQPRHLQDRYYRWCSRVDDAGLGQVLEVFADPATAPRLTWWSTIVTDAGHHAGGPRSEVAQDSLRDADRRLAAFLAHLDGLGVTEQVTFLLTADHGFEAADEAVTGSWAEVLDVACARLGVTYRDEGPGFIYLNP
ncbi:MAG TPA: alkaline phosphatase family protein [Kineosporiaceae bacterium]|nr:alkaline phosphatase family protein [Kineosporiaceae bacterium]